MMKTEMYPQIFDKTGNSLRGYIEYNHLYHKYKINELTGNALQKHEELVQSFKMLNKIIRLPQILFMLSGYALMMIFVGILNALPDVGFIKAYKNAPVLFWLLPVFFILTVAAGVLFSYKKKKHTYAVAELTATTGKEVDRLIKDNLNIPEDTVEICFFQRLYRPGKAKTSLVFCQGLKAFTDELNVYLFWNTAVFKIPKRDCLMAEGVAARAIYSDQIPSVDYRSPEIKQYKIKKNNNNGTYITNQFGRLLFQADGETWSLDILPFSFEAAKKIFGKE